MWIIFSKTNGREGWKKGRMFDAYRTGRLFTSLIKENYCFKHRRIGHHLPFPRQRCPDSVASQDRIQERRTASRFASFRPMDKKTMILKAKILVVAIVFFLFWPEFLVFFSINPERFSVGQNGSN